MLTEQQAGTTRPVAVNWRFLEQRLELRRIALEQRTGNMIPDILCEATDADGQDLGPLMVEVTVTNPLGEERIRRLRATGKACIEINLASTGGRINREDLEQAVLRSTTIKRWIHFPGEESLREELRRRLQIKLDRITSYPRPLEPSPTQYGSNAGNTPESDHSLPPADGDHRLESTNYWLKGAALARWLREHPDRIDLVPPEALRTVSEALVREIRRRPKG